MPLFISSCEKAPIHRCGAERSYIHSLFLKENVKEKETPEPLRATYYSIFTREQPCILFSHRILRLTFNQHFFHSWGKKIKQPIPLAQIDKDCMNVCGL